METPPISGRPANGLGAKISDHPQSVVGSRGRMIQSYVALGIGAALALAGLVTYLAWAESARMDTLICLGFGGLCGLGIGAMGVMDARSTRDMSLTLYERGLRYVDKVGQKEWRWEEIAAITQHQVVSSDTNRARLSYQVTSSSGDTLHLYDHVRDPAGAIATIRQRVYALLLPRMQADLDAGRPVAFGPVTIAAAGMTVRGRETPWAEIAGVTLSGGSVMVERRGGGWLNDAEISRGEIPNAELLAQLAAQRARPDA
jgi:hypothetical protein